MASRICYSCGVRSHHRLWGDSASKLLNRLGQPWAAPYRCDECGALSIAITHLAGNQSPKSAAENFRSTTIDEWLPVKGIGRAYHDAVPEHIASAASEAHACRSITALRAAILMARSVIEATAKDHNITSGKLNVKIDTMHDQGLIRELVRHQAHEIRYFGNDMAHGDFVEPVDPEEADEILELMDELLAEVYEAPAKLKARQQAREARAADDTPAHQGT